MKHIFVLIITLIVAVAVLIPVFRFELIKTGQPFLVEQTPVIPTPQEFLRQEIEKAGLATRDYAILYEIVQCESTWSQVWERDFNGHIKGEVKVSKGNIGLAQINRPAHHEEYERLGLDPFNEFDNLKYAVILYKRNGVRDWEKWSGHCWKPILAKQGIYF